MTSHLYSRLLLPAGHGYPLPLPQPDHSFLERRAAGIEIGDVGVLTSDDSFDVFFNIRKRNDPVNRPGSDWGLPEGFEEAPVTLDDCRLWEDHFRPESHVSDMQQGTLRVSLDAEVNSNTQVLSIPVTAGSVVEIQSSHTKTAALFLPEGASRINLRLLNKFEQQAKKHGKNWYAFLRSRGVKLDDDDLYLVTGVDKSTSWNVSAKEKHSSDKHISLKLRVAQVASANGSVGWEWQHEGGFSNSGPQLPTGQLSTCKNQTMFLRGFKISLRPVFGTKVKSIEKLKASDILKGKGSSFGSSQQTQNESPPGSSSQTQNNSSSGSSPQTQNESPSGSSQGTQESSAGTHNPHVPTGDMQHEANTDDTNDTDSITASHIPAPFKVNTSRVRRKILSYIISDITPANVINAHIFAVTSPDISVAVTHDDQWISVLEEDEKVPDDDELIRRILFKYSVEVESGCVYLKPLDTRSPTEQAGQPMELSVPSPEFPAPGNQPVTDVQETRHPPEPSPLLSTSMMTSQIPQTSDMARTIGQLLLAQDLDQIINTVQRGTITPVPSPTRQPWLDSNFRPAIRGGIGGDGVGEAAHMSLAMVQGRVGGQGGEGVTIGAGGMGEASKFSEPLYEGDASDTPSMSVDDFCQQYHVSEEIRKLLEEEGFEATGDLFQVSEDNLREAGLKDKQIAEVKRALNDLATATRIISDCPSGQSG
ncbi:hypothetical protein MSAN_02440700 [Mycena sanguinolenta]|uniref:SAM domain-containing protein n=1 Tax=Mycena sanguinolenta TaxID=230812 RepID=A0A8H6WZ93_9AGAR|nr:hypothetical protein MSAN_02440700 [Mycena sanguinolenta]